MKKKQDKTRQQQQKKSFQDFSEYKKKRVTLFLYEPVNFGRSPVVLNYITASMFFPSCSENKYRCIKLDDPPFYSERPYIFYHPKMNSKEYCKIKSLSFIFDSLIAS